MITLITKDKGMCLSIVTVFQKGKNDGLDACQKTIWAISYFQSFLAIIVKNNSE